MFEKLRRGFDRGMQTHASALATIPSSIQDGLGAAVADVMTDGSRKKVWYHNHLLANSGVIGTNLAKQAGIPVGYEHLGGAALALGVVPIATGNFNPLDLGDFGRKDGYKAVFPDENDPTETTNPVGEVLSRYFLGRTGRILSYDLAKQETPGLTKEQYDLVTWSQSPENTRLFGLEDNPVLSAAIGAMIGGGVRAVMARPGGTQVVVPAPNPNNPATKYLMEIPTDNSPADFRRKAVHSAVIGGLLGALAPIAAGVGAVKEVEQLDGGTALQALGYQAPLGSIVPVGLGAAGIYAAAKALGNRNLRRLTANGTT